MGAAQPGHVSSLGCTRAAGHFVRVFLAAGLLLAAPASTLEQQPSPPPAPAADILRIASGIRDSYYHPDDLDALACDVNIDWDALAAQVKRSPEGQHIEALKQARVKVHAARGKETQVDVEWGPDEVANKDVLEEGMRKAMSGFFTMYWPLDASSIAPTADENPKLEARDDGGYLLQFNTADAQVAEEVDKRGVVTRIRYTSPAPNAISGSVPVSSSDSSTTILEPRFSEAPNDVPGHPRLLTAVEITQQSDASKAAVHVALDYQSAGGVHIPSHLTFAIEHSYTFPLQFTGCSVTRAARTAPSTAP